MKKILIVGGGAGGLELAVSMSKKYKNQFKIILIDKEKTHIWKPHLHEVAAGSLDSNQEQIDYLNLAKKFNFEFVWGEMQSINRANKQLILKEYVEDNELILPQRIFSYDNLVIGIGSTSNHFETPGVVDFSYSLDNLQSANNFHKSLINKILQKEYIANNQDSFKINIIGGGATGVELAAELTQTIDKLSYFGLHNLQKNPVKITVINAANQLLPGLSDKISNGAKEILEKANVSVLNNTKVLSLNKGITKILKENQEIDLFSDLTVWAAGVKSPDILSNLDGLNANKNNQLIVNDYLQTNDENIFAIGDCASIKWLNSPKENMMVPPRAQAAHQMSDYLSNNFNKIINKEKVKPFIYKDYGSLISLGTSQTVGTLMGFLKGKSMFLEGKFAKMLYINLYYHHQVKINGLSSTFLMFLNKSLQKSFKPKVKLH